MANDAHRGVTASNSDSVKHRVRRMNALLTERPIQRINIIPHRNDPPYAFPAQQVGLHQPGWLIADNQI